MNVRKIKRIDLDGLKDILRDIRELPSSRELALTATKIEEAIMWLEKDMANDAS